MEMQPSPPPIIAGEQTGFIAGDSGLTVGTGDAGDAGKKRGRDSLSFLPEELASHLHHQMLDLDHLLIQHTHRVWDELAERRRRFTRQLAAAVEHGVCKRLKAKDDEILRAKRVNLALEERVRSLSMESQVWRELAQANEATANLLRTNLEHILAAQLQAKEEQQRCDAAAADDAESCCSGESDGPAGPPVGPPRACRSCGEREPTVLVLPCRHLCLCVGCGRTANFCPICKCSKSGSVNVNFS